MDEIVREFGSWRVSADASKADIVYSTSVIFVV